MIGEKNTVSHKNYAEKWAAKMTEAYRIASEKNRLASARGKSYYDKKLKGVVLHPGDRVLVRNFTEHGGPGKLRSYWKKNIYVVKEQVTDNPVYVVYPKSGDKHKTRVLHRNLLLLVNDLPVEAPPHRSEHIPKRQVRQNHNRPSHKARQTEHRSDTSESDSKIMAITIPVQTHPVSVEIDKHAERHKQEVTVPVRAEGHVIVPISEDQRDGHSVTQSLPDSVPPEMDSEGDEPLVPTEEETPTLTPAADATSGIRRSARQRRPRQIFTYQTLGELSLRPHPSVNTIVSLLSHYIPAWTTYHHGPPSTGFAPYHSYPHMPYT